MLGRASDLLLRGSLLLAGLGGQELGGNAWEDTTLGDGNTTQELVELLVVSDGELEVTGDDTGLLVVTSGVSGQLEDLSGEVLEDGSQVDWGTSTNSLGVVAVLEVTVDTSDWELETSLGGSRERLGVGSRSLQEKIRV